MEQKNLDEVKEFLTSLNRAYDNELINTAIECIDKVQSLETLAKTLSEECDRLARENAELRILAVRGVGCEDIQTECDQYYCNNVCKFRKNGECNEVTGICPITDEEIVDAYIKRGDENG